VSIPQSDITSTIDGLSSCNYQTMCEICESAFFLGAFVGLCGAFILLTVWNAAVKK